MMTLVTRKRKLSLSGRLVLCRTVYAIDVCILYKIDRGSGVLSSRSDYKVIRRQHDRTGSRLYDQLLTAASED